jgi:hypothetical protein
MHDKAVVSALLDRLSRATDLGARQLLLGGLARLHFHEGEFIGDWWTTRPSHIGPYYLPVAWEDSPRIRSALRHALLGSRSADLVALGKTLILNRVLPQGSDSLVNAVAASGDARGMEALGELVGLSDLNEAAVDMLSTLNQTTPALREEIVNLVLAQPRQFVGSIALLGPAALDTALAPAYRERVLNAIGAAPDLAGTEAAMSIFARLNPVGADDSPIAAGWRRWVSNARRNDEIDYFVRVTQSAARAERVLGYAVLLRIRGPNTEDLIRTKVNPVISTALASPASARELAEAVAIMGLDNQYQTRLRAAGVGATP